MVIIVGRFNSIVNQRTGLYRVRIHSTVPISSNIFIPLIDPTNANFSPPPPFSLSLLIYSDKFLSSIYWKFMGEKLEEFTIPRKDDGSSREITILPVSFSGARGF